MAMLSCVKSDVLLNAIGQELDVRYGKGETYKDFDPINYRETYTHITEDHIKRTFELDRFVMERNLRGNEWSNSLRLIEEDHSHHCPEMSPKKQPRHVIKQGFEPIYDWELPKSTKPKKKSKLIGNIRERLQKETDNWLKSVQKEED
jgi:hypothetical protein